MNDIDVSKCRYNYISITGDSCCYAESERHVIMRECEDFPNCYYRQLQQLKAENEKLKEKINENNYCYNELLKLKDFFFNKSKTFYNCLDEIEEVANDNSFPSDFDVYEERDFYFYQLCKIDNILQKIKQAKEGEKE